MQADEKLEAAFHFLEEMRKSVENRKVFIFNLDAFLSTSRSVTFVLQKEFEGDTKFRKWYREKQEEMKKDELMNFFVKMRDFSIHERSPETQAVTSVFITETISISDSVSIRVTHPNGTEEKFEPKPPIVERKQPAAKENSKVLHAYFFVGRTDNDVIALCSQYCEKLFRLVTEAKTVLAS
jgi:hypothetical protein